MRHIKEHYPHIYRQLKLLEGDNETLINYIRSITIYELSDSRPTNRNGFVAEAFTELFEILDDLTKVCEVIHTKNP